MYRITIAISLAVGLVLAACGGGSSAGSPGGGAAAGTEIKVSLSDFAYTPKTVEVPADKKFTLVVTNTGSVEHDFAVDALKIKIVVLPRGIRRSDTPRYERMCAPTSLMIVPAHSESCCVTDPDRIQLGLLSPPGEAGCSLVGGASMKVARFRASSSQGRTQACVCRSRCSERLRARQPRSTSSFDPSQARGPHLEVLALESQPDEPWHTGVSAAVFVLQSGVPEGGPLRFLYRTARHAPPCGRRTGRAHASGHVGRDRALRHEEL